MLSYSDIYRRSRFSASLTIGLLMLFAVASPSELRRVLARDILGFCLMHFLGSFIVPKCLPPASSLSNERGTPSFSLVLLMC